MASTMPPLDLRTRLMVEGSALGDLALRTALASVLSGAMLPWTLSPDARREARRLGFYAGLAEQPAIAFPRPVQPVEIAAQPAARRAYHPHAGELCDLSFTSPYIPVNPGVREDYARLGHNRTAWAQHWTHADEPRPTLCVIHGFGASPYWLNSAFFSLPWFFKLGYDVLLYVMPLHGRRRTPWVPMNGLEMFAHGFCRMTETILQGVYDFRIFLDHLEASGVEQIGVTGLSLGGYMSALLATLEERLAVVVPNAPVTTLARLFEQWFPASALIPIAAAVHRIPAQSIATSLALHSPLSYAPVVAKERLMIIGGLGDRMAPPEQSRLLWEHWDRPRSHWYPGNHTVHIARRGYLYEMRDFMADLGFR